MRTARTAATSRATCAWPRTSPTARRSPSRTPSSTGRRVEADRRKDEFLAVLSHELRTPLNAIVGWSARAAGGPTASPEHGAQGAWRRSTATPRLQTQLISDILDVSRIVAGKLRLDVRPIELHVVIEAALDTLRPAAQAKRVRLETVLDPGAGPDLRRRRPAAAGRLEPPLQRHQVRPREDVGRVQVRAGGHQLPRPAHRGRQRPGHRSRVPAPRLRALPAGGLVERTGCTRGWGWGWPSCGISWSSTGAPCAPTNREERSGAIFIIELPRRSVAAARPWRAEPRSGTPASEEPMWLDDRAVAAWGEDPGGGRPGGRARAAAARSWSAAARRVTVAASAARSAGRNARRSGRTW